jgi:hypothetical protein
LLEGLLERRGAGLTFWIVQPQHKDDRDVPFAAVEPDARIAQPPREQNGESDDGDAPGNTADHYVCLVVLLIGSLIRFDREPYTWKSDSSQMLRKGQLRLGSNLFHYGVIVVILGHFAGFLAPHWT